MKKRILLHACCAVCTAGVYEQLKNDFEINLFCYNPNIAPKTEHDRRLNELLNYCDKIGVEVIIGDYSWQEEHDFWLRLIKGKEAEPEKGLPAEFGYKWQAGKRCQICYKMRLEAPAAVATEINKHHKNEFDYFAAELSISPHKDAEKMNQIGQKLAKKYGIKYLDSDFKKNDGFKIASEISKKENLYRQNYCGCEFSK